jgi:opacity protein-like surface antigen
MFALAGALTLQIAGARAADMPITPPPLPVLQYGWYLRGDLGYNWGRVGDAESTAPFLNPTLNELGDSLMVGAGAGIKTQWLRTDVTIDYLLPMKYQGGVAVPGDVTAKIAAASALFNGYLDLGTWYHVTPYVGAGAGAAAMWVCDYSSALTPPFTGDGAHQQWNFAWAAMAGLGVAVAPNLIVDVGYRYIDFGDVETARDAFGGVTFKDVAAHEVRVGVRWSFDDGLGWQ